MSIISKLLQNYLFLHVSRLQQLLALMKLHSFVISNEVEVVQLFKASLTNLSLQVVQLFKLSSQIFLSKLSSYLRFLPTSFSPNCPIIYAIPPTHLSLQVALLHKLCQHIFLCLPLPVLPSIFQQKEGSFICC